MMTGIWSVGKV